MTNIKLWAFAALLLATHAHAEPATITGPSRVIDGDTVVVGETHVAPKGR